MSKEEEHFIGRLGSKAKQIVVNVANYFKAQSKMSFIEQTVQATGVGRRTVFRVRKEFHEHGKVASPQRSKRTLYKPLDNFDLCIVEINKTNVIVNIK